MTQIQDAFTVMYYDCRVALAKMFMAKVKLLSTVGRELEKLYVLRSIRGPNTEPRMFYNSKLSNFDLGGFHKLANELDDRNNQLPKPCQIQQRANLDWPNAPFLHLHRVYLRMVFLLVLEALHRPLSLSGGRLSLSV
ncbi:uncharacterized protein Z519_12788 [Cladophialophora bantiana CBS 173.52]|uniref:Uncharacterized protein n=1 Tax=Cladophialophora bantiana (strain ATCC 10958 / CBS 173.52 / CDC B-1940 / NIH 8579) TaxID=1442370 RepID=A0A0D2HQ84_CLAB1|nr:uncharacterized protein Z519_12788 [Cladophialophora bantiana CBS 173.52]KIW86604.1 hypothetical protein Z519_12788 [Cladophialophora bantiana CBS 173.52]